MLEKIISNDTKLSTGTILDHYTVLTCAHGIEREDKISFFYGNSNNIIEAKVDEVIIHPNFTYNDRIISYDTALLKFTAPLHIYIDKESRFPRIDSYSKIDQAESYSVGFGIKIFSGKNSIYIPRQNILLNPRHLLLHEVNSGNIYFGEETIITDEFSQNKNFFKIQDNNILYTIHKKFLDHDYAFIPNTKKALEGITTKGDSGGPLFLMNNDGKISGTVTASVNNQDFIVENFQDVRIPEIKSFIESNMGNPFMNPKRHRQNGCKRWSRNDKNDHAPEKYTLNERRPLSPKKYISYHMMSGYYTSSSERPKTEKMSSRSFSPSENEKSFKSSEKDDFFTF